MCGAAPSCANNADGKLCHPCWARIKDCCSNDEYRLQVTLYVKGPVELCFLKKYGQKMNVPVSFHYKVTREECIGFFRNPCGLCSAARIRQLSVLTRLLKSGLRLAKNKIHFFIYRKRNIWYNFFKSLIWVLIYMSEKYILNKNLRVFL